MENGISISDISTRGNKDLYAYLFRECIANLCPDLVGLLKRTSCFNELDPAMLDFVLGKKNTGLMLESLVTRNIFTFKTGDGLYRYHALFRKNLLEMGAGKQSVGLLRKAAYYYFDHRQFSKAAQYALDSGDWRLLERIILSCYRDYIKDGRYNDLRIWFQALPEKSAGLNPKTAVAKGAFLSVMGNFVEAKACLEKAIPIGKSDKELYFEAMIHMARVLRNFVSFEESNRLLDGLIPGLRTKLKNLPML